MIDRSLNYGRHHIQRFLSSAKPYEKILDLGAGTGADLDISKLVAPSATRIAVEVYQPYAEELRRSGVQVLNLDIERDVLPFDASELTVVVANQILEHTKEIFWIFHEVSRVLSVGGHFIVGVPNLASMHNRVLLALGRQPSPIKSASAHVRGFTKPDLLDFVDRIFPGGYRLKSFGGSNFYPFPPLLARPLARLFPTWAWGIFMMFEKVREYNQEFIEFPINEKLETNFYVGIPKDSN